MYSPAKRSWKSGLLLLTILLSVLLASSASAKPSEPIRVKKAEVKSLALIKLAFKPQQGSDEDIVATEEWLSVLSDRLQSFGYNIVGTTKDRSVFNDPDKHAADMLLGGTVEELTCDKAHEYENVAICGVSVRWELMDAESDKVVYTVTTRHRRELCVDEMSDEEDRLFFGAIDSLLSKPGFVRALRVEEPQVSSAASQEQEAATFAACQAEPLQLPDQMNPAKDGVVTIRAGSAVGAGFYVSPDGIILTAGHVVSGHDEVEVRDRFGKAAKATVLRRNRKQDVALLRVDTSQSACLTVETELPGTGTQLYAIGSPGGEDFAFSVSAGIVSAIRSAEGRELIQTDASINAGNSGGPFLNESGQVVGIVQAKLAVPGYEGLGFGVPIESALSALAVSPGDDTTVTAPRGRKARHEEPRSLADADDPPLDQLEVSPTSEYKMPPITFRQRYLYNGGRWAYLLSGPVLATAGGIMAFTSKNVYQASEVSGADAVGAPDFENGTTLSESEYKRLKTVNTAGLIMVGTGALLTSMFFLSPRREARILEDAKQSASRTRLQVAFTGTGAVLRGSF